MRLLAHIEGTSAVLLFFLAMPLKYLAGNEALMYPVGMAHGLLFVLYTAALFAFYLLYKQWSFPKLLLLFVLAIFPLGTFYADWKGMYAFSEEKEL